MEIIGKVYSLESALEDKAESEKVEFASDNLIGMLFNDCQNYPLLSEEREAKLMKAAKEGCMKSRDIFISSNERLVINFAKKYLNSGVPWEDLIGDGNEGLITAYEKFNPDMGYKFSTYAVWWIRQSITRNISDFKRIIRIPVHMLETGSKYKKMKKSYELEHGELKLKTFDQLENFARYIVTKNEQNKLDKAIKVAKKESEKTETQIMPKYKKLSQEEFDQKVSDHIGTIPKVLEYLWQEPISLDFPTNETSFLVDLIESDKNPSDRIFNHKKEALRSYMLSKLSDRERRVIEYRFGLEDGWQRTLEEVAKKFGRTRERIRQIEANALSKLRTAYTNEDRKEIEALREYYKTNE